jgi:phosphatidylglycerol lysyltransferase
VGPLNAVRERSTPALFWATVGLPAVQRLAAYLRSAPLTLGILGIFLAAGVLTDSFLDGPPEELLPMAGVSAPGLRAGNWWSLVTSLFFATNPLAYLVASLMILLLLGLAERKLGKLRTAALLLGGQFAAVTVFLLVTQLARFAGDGWLGLMTDSALIGPYAAVLAVSMASSGKLPVLWRRRLRTAVLSVALLLVLYVGHAETVIGLVGALVGLAASWWAESEHGPLHAPRSTGRETRNLLALTVAVFAVGPILTTITRTPTGPLALLRDVLLNPVPTLGQLEANCGSTVEAACLEVGRTGFAGPFGLALAVVPVALLLICADGMRRGRSMALRIALVIQVAITALAAVYLALFALIPHYPSRPQTAAMGSGFAHILPLVTVPLLLAVLLWVNRRQFRVETVSAARHRLALVVGGVWLVLAGGYTVAWLAAGGMMRDGGPLGLLAELARQYLPVPLPNLYRRVFAERDSIEALIFGYSGPLFWLVALAGVWSVLVGRHHGSDSGHNDRTAARRLLHQGGESLSWMALWEPNRYWFSPDGRGAVAYQQHGTVALTLAGPFGAAESRGPTAKGFIDYCGSRALAPAFYSCDGTLWPMLRDRGFQRVPVAQETRLSVRELDFKGKEWQNVRTARNRAAKLGVTAVWGTYHGLPSTLRARLSEVSEEWAAAKSIPEMGFTLGGIDELMDEEVLCCLAVDTDGNVHGVTSWLPVYDGGKLVSRTLDVMRRGAEGFPGVMEFLIAAAVVELRETVEVISLSGSPLASLPDGDTTLDQVPAENLLRILDVVGHALEPVYGFRSLAAFKSRFQPEYRTLYLYYQDPLQLPAIGRALTRAYLPGLSLRQGARLVRELVG